MSYEQTKVTKIHSVTSEILEDGLSLKLTAIADVKVDDVIKKATITYHNVALIPTIKTYNGKNKAYLSLTPTNDEEPILYQINLD